jgi:hypothetical protein
MAALWRGVVTGGVAPAMPAFFPQAAYLQVKAIADPAADWRSRLAGGYALDVAAAHRLLGAHPEAAAAPARPGSGRLRPLGAAWRL